MPIVEIGTFAVVLSACSGSPATTNTNVATTTNNNAATTTNNYALAQEMRTSIEDFAAEWNQNNLRWVTALTDPEVSWEDFVSTQHDVGFAQLGLLTEFDIWVQSLDPAVRPARGRFQAMNDEVFPAALGDDEAAFEAAINRYQSFSLPENTEPAIRTFVFHPVIAEAMRSDGIDPEVFMQSLMRSFGAG